MIKKFERHILNAAFLCGAYSNKRKWPSKNREIRRYRKGLDSFGAYIKMIFRYLHLNKKNCILTLIGSAILAFGLYQIHSFSGVTEGGVLGATLLFYHLFDISPAISGFIMNAICYILGWRMLGKEFIGYSVIAGGSFSLYYAIFERFEPFWPQLADLPLAAALLGALFVGVGAGLCVRSGGAPSGDDALAMAISKLVRIRIQWVYLISDLIVLALSISYIPIRRLMYSLLTVVLSGQLIGLIQRLPFHLKKIMKEAADKTESN